MENKLRRGLALLMTLIMLISCAPMDALAAIVPVSGGTQTSSGVSLKSIVKPPVATTTYVFMNGTEEFARQILKNGEALNNPGTPDSGSPNKEFTGWRDGDNNAPVFGAVTVTDTKTITYHAQFADVYFVFFTNEKGEVMVTKKGANGDTISTDGVTYPVGNEQSIVGWKDASGNLVSSVTLNGRDVTLTAKVENGHWITYDSQGGTYVAPAFVKGNGTTTAPAAPTRPGYTFRHWSAAVGGAAFTFGQPLDQALTLHAVWTANTDTRYTVIHWQENADDDEYSYAESETKTGATGAQTSAAAKSYTGFTVQTIAQQTIAGDGSTIVNVYYKRNTYTLTFRELTCERWHTHRDSCYKVRKTITAKYQADIHGNFPIKDGTETIWWTVPDNCQSFVSGNYLGSIDTMPAENITFSKKASESGAKLYYYVETLDGAAGDIAYNGKNYKLYKEIDLEYSTSTSLTYAEEFHPITGFTQGDSDPYLPVNGKVRMNRNNYLYYTRNSYNIVYVSGGEKVNTASKKFEQSIADAGSYTPPVKPVGQEDYVFGGWYADEATTKPYDFTGKTMPAQNVTVYAKWNKPVYNGTIYLTIEGTGSSIRINVPKGDTIETALNEKQAEIMAQVGEGYTWRGWRTGKDGTGEPFNPQTQITTDITLYPYYTKDGTFTVEYVSGKNDVTAPVDGKSYAEGSFADLMSPGALVSGDGEYFLGWSDGAATYQPRDKYQIKSNHAKENVITLTAQWGARPAGTTLTYKANGGAGADKVENLANNATVTTIANPFKRAGYTFAGWDTDASASTGSIGENEQVQVDSDGENILYAIWTANTDTKYTVEFYYQNTDGTYTLNHSDKRTATTDTEVSVTADDKAAKENNKYVFEADNKNNVLSGVVAGNGSLVLKLYFKLNTASYTIHHYLNGTTVKVADDQTGAKTIGETLTADKSDALYAAYAAAEVAVYAPSQSITIAADESENVITVYYTMPLTIKAKDASKTYDGKPLTNNGFTFTEGVLVKGDVLTAVVEGSATNVGDEGKNVVKSYKVMRGDVDVTGNYTFTDSVDGKLTINKRTVTLKSEGGSKEYDGTPLTKPVVTVGGDGFVTGEVTDVKATGSVTFVHEGEVTNAITYTEGANYKESNYTITKDEGKLSITKREGEGKTITVTANSDEKVYDGAPLTNNGFTHAGALVEGDTLTAVVEGSQTDVGSSDNVVTSYRVMRGETDVTTSYTFADSVKGALTVTLRGVTFTGESKSLPYTGGMQSITGITQSGLVEGHRYEGLTYKAEGQNVDSYDGAFSGDVVIKDAQGNDVTKNYNVTKTPGKLTITNASFTVTFTGESDTKVYNGSEQSITGITVDGLKPGHRYEGLTYAAKGTDKGEYVGAFTGTVKILDENNVDVTENYAVTKTPGKLAITAVTDEVVVTITGHKDTVTYDGTEHTVKGYDVSISNELYKEADFTFTGSAEVKATNASDTAYAMGLKDTDFANKNGNFSNVTFKVTDGELVINKRPVKVYAEKLEYLYDYKNPAAHPADDVARYTVEAANGDRGLLTGDALNADVLYDGQSTQTLIGVYQAVAQIAAAKITNANGDVTANYTIEKVDSTLTIKGNDPLDPGKETTSVQTNYTVGDVIEYKITVKNVSRDEATNVVVTDSMAEIQDSVGYTVSEDRHMATIDSIKPGKSVVLTARHTVTAEDVENAYAGDANGSLTNVANIKFGDWNKDVEGDHDELNDTYEYVVRYYWNNYTSVQPHEEKKLTARVGTEVTEKPAAIEGYTPVSADSKKLTISADQSKNVIEFYYYKNVELTANSKTETYDGTEKQVNGFTVKGENKDQDDQTIAADFSAITVGAKDIDAGEYPANFAENTVGTVDKTGRYIVAAANNGKLVINPVTGQLIIITANSARKTYDGTPLTDNNFTFTQGVLADGDVLTAVVEGSATNVGDEGKNVVKSYAVKRGETDVTKNYTFGNSIDGKLTINPRKVTLTSETASKEYDGKPLTKPVVTVTGDGFVTGEGATYTFTGSQTVVGSSANAFTYTLNEGTNAGNYEVAKTEGMLTVTQNEKAIKVTANSHTWEYDGQAHSDGGYTVEYDGQTYKVEAGKTVTLPTGDIVKAKITKTVTNVSDSAPNNNTIDELTIVNAAGEDTKGQYKTIPLIPGTLTITKRGAGEEKVKITAADNTVEYDGQPHGAKLNAANQIEVGTSFTVTNLADGHSVKTLAIDGSETDAGVYANKLVPGNAVIVDGNGVEVTANYDITYVPGTLTITQRGSGDMKVVLTAANNTVVYDGQPHGAKLNAAGEIEAGTSYTITNLADGHKVQSVVISGSETAVGEYENRLVPSGAKIVDAEDNDVTRNYVVGYKNGKLTITSPDTVIVTIKGKTDTVEYDGQKHEVNGYEVVSISNTLYTEADFGFADGATAHAEGTDAGDYFMNLTKDSFVNKNGNFTSVTFVVEDGKLTITRRGLDEENLVKIIAADNTVYYDGQPHGAKLNAAGQIEVNVSYTTEYLAPGHKVQSVVIDGSRTKVGLYKDELVPKSAVIVDKTDKDVTENYEITYVRGTLEIKKNETEIKVTANSHTWEYDGQAHSDGGYTVTYGNESYTVKAGESATLSTGDKVTAVVKGQVKDVDDTKAGNNEIVEWSVEHRDFYNNVTPANGTLTITPRKVTLTSASDSKPYDGTPLTKPEVAVTGDGFVAGEVSDIEATGSVTYVSQGEVDNLITFKKNEGFKDSNYGIEEKIGKLSIEALDVTIIITGPSAKKKYMPGVTHTIVTGGSELDFVYGSDKVEGKIGVKGMVEGDKILPGTLKHTLEGMYVGEYEGVFTLFDSNGKKADKPTVMHDGVDVTENYKFSYNPGKLTITGKHMDGDKEVENEVPEKKYLLGQKIPFTITVRSVSKDELKDVTVTDPTATILPDRNTANPAYTVSEDGHTATITSIAPEAEVIVYAEHEVTEDDIINRYTNEATINWGDDVVEVSKTPSIEEKNPEAELVKEIVLQDGQDENHKFKLGETVYFKITVTNTGNVTLNEYEVKEVLPGAAFIDGTGYTLNNDKTVATIEKMEPVKDGQEAPDSNQIVLYAQYTIKEEDLGNKELKNIVTADNSKPGEVPIPVDEAKSVSGQKIWKDEGNAFNTRPASITLTLMRKLGQNGAAEQYRTMQLGSNGSWRYSFDHLPKHDAQENEYFYWVVEEPVTGYDTAYETKDESHCDIVNNLQTYTLTIHYWQHKLGDTKMEQAFPDYVATLYYKQPYDVESPEREGIILDDMSQARISGTMPVHDLVIDVYYHRIAYRLTIHYIYRDGTMAHEDYTWTYWFNSTYNVPSPIIPGFTPSIDVIAGRMPSHGLELTVVYVGDGEIVIPDEDTSLGFKSYLNAGECFE